MIWIQPLEAELELQKYQEKINNLVDLTKLKITGNKIIATIGSEEFRPTKAMMESAAKSLKKALTNDFPLIVVPWYVKLEVLKIS